MTGKKHVVVICGYGCHLDTPLRSYLDRIVRFIQKNKPYAIVFCGGYTQKKTSPNVSEADLMHDYVKSKIGLEVVMLETNSYTTFKNIQKASEHMDFHGFPDTIRITIFCEATRAANVIMLARYFLMSFVDSIDDITVETANWERADTFKQARNLIYNKLALKFPFLGLAEREHRYRIHRSNSI
ncbi:MAG: YdcF family protein [Candidatus Yanofskybacteria bacterium]|nr:YdcF family protein [Candidatus Yanofskybacteria bacterium]